MIWDSNLLHEDIFLVDFVNEVSSVSQMYFVNPHF